MTTLYDRLRKLIDFGGHLTEQDRSDIREAAKAVARLDQLRKTEDGVPITPGMTIYRLCYSGAIDEHHVDSISATGWTENGLPWEGQDFSTRELAEKARGTCRP